MKMYLFFSTLLLKEKMEQDRLHRLINDVPTIRRAPITQGSTWTGAHWRIRFALFCAVPIMYCFDQNGGLMTLGFNRGTTMRMEYKMRPDYATGRVFAAERTDLPAFKQLQ